MTVTNNIIVDNVAGLAGGGIAMADTLNSSIINNTIASNDSVGIVGALFNIPNNPTTAYPNPAGVVSEPTSPQLAATLGRTLLSAAQKAISNPQLINNIIWQNRSFYFDASSGTAQDCASNKYADAPAHMCGTQTAYWDLGVLGDKSTTPGTNHLNPTTSVLTSTAGYSSTNISTDPQFNTTYFNSSTASKGLLLPPEAYAAFATLDEGGNFVDVSYGPLTITGDYRFRPALRPIDKGASTFAPNHDILGTKRPQGAGYDIGAFEYAQAPQHATLSPSSLWRSEASSTVKSRPCRSRCRIRERSPLTNIAVSFAKAVLNPYSQSNTCGTTLAVGTSCTISVTFAPALININTSNTLNVADGAGTQTVTLSGNRNSALGDAHSGNPGVRQRDSRRNLGRAGSDADQHGNRTADHRRRDLPLRATSKRPRSTSSPRGQTPAAPHWPPARAASITWSLRLPRPERS